MKVCSKPSQEKIDKKSQHKVIQCLKAFMNNKVLEAITTAAEHRNIGRFHPIIEVLRDHSVQLQVACMQLINALVTSPDDLDFRLHIRNEFMRCGLKAILPHLNIIKSDALDIQLKVFEEHKEEDMIEFAHHLEDIRCELEYPFKQ
ncbi:UNVERIFIED_CONTAM: hypothetical protein FKN15_015958 [Acipenser sinensis]